MEVATGAMSPVIRKLGELLADEYNLEKRVKKGVRSLLTELELMHAVLRKVGEVPSDQLDEDVRIWASKVRELSYDMEDAVDDFLVRVDEGSSGEPMNMKNRVKKFIKKTTKLFSKGKVLHEISDAIQEIQELAKELAEQRNRYQLDMRSIRNGATIDPRVMALHKDVAELVGIDHTKDELVKKLIGENGSSMEQLKIVSVFGVGGLGKTTLTKVVYEKIKSQFNCAAFVPVGQNPDVKKVLKNILYGLDKDKFKDIHNTTRDENLLMEEMSELLMDKRYLIVIDDIWEEKTWGYISCALPKNRLYSRVITTTRNMSVSEACLSSSDDMMHRMEPLSDEDSQVLFHRRIFQGKEKCPEHLHIVSRDILKKCGGVPLAIITIASLLVSKQQIKQKDDWLNLLNSMGRGVTQDGILKDMKRILSSLSYYDLASHLKCCLLHLCIFPEDFKIVKDRLIWMWIGEGFVQRGKEEKMSLFEIGERYFNELINRSLIQAAKENIEGEVELCSVHDMVLDLICSLSSEENFVSILDIDEWHPPKLEREARRLSLRNNKAGIRKDQFDRIVLSKVRSFVVFCAAPCDWLQFITSFQFLRVLDPSDCSSSSLKYVENLIHLRYLRLRSVLVDQLPKDIGKLQLSQILDIWGTSIKELPASVVQLGRLICLYVDDDVRLPKGMGNLTSLEVLRVKLSLSPHIVKKLRHLTEVRTLTIDWAGMDEDQINVLIESLAKLHKLQHLTIRKGGILIDLMREGWMPPPTLRSFDTWGWGSVHDEWFKRLPKWINSTTLPLLSMLAIKVEELHGDDIQIIGMLPTLCGLVLRASRVTEKLAVSADAFPSLLVIIFAGVPTSPSLFQPGTAPRLDYLQFSVSARFIASGEVDCSMGHLPSLKQVYVELVDEANASDEEVETAKAVMRAAAEAHHKRPSIEFYSGT